MNTNNLTSLRAWNLATVQQVLILKFPFGPDELSDLSRNGPQGAYFFFEKQPNVKKKL